MIISIIIIIIILIIILVTTIIGFIPIHGMTQNPIWLLEPRGLEQGELASLYAGASLILLCSAMDDQCQEGRQAIFLTEKKLSHDLSWWEGCYF